MIRKGNKKVIPYKGDYKPVAIYKGNHPVFTYEKKTASGKEVSIVSEYKPKPRVEINGDESQIVKDVNVESVVGKAVLVNFTDELPSDYQEVEYIESTGTQYIDLGKMQYVNYLEFSIELTDNTGDILIFGLYPPAFSLGLYNGMWRGNVQTPQSQIENANINENYVAKYIDGYWSINNKDIGAPKQINNSLDNVYLFRRNYGSTSTPQAKCKIRYFKTTSINLIPCYRKSDNEIGMYDIVSKTFYTNQGTGTFLKGADKNKILGAGEYKSNQLAIYGVKTTITLSNQPNSAWFTNRVINNIPNKESYNKKYLFKYEFSNLTGNTSQYGINDLFLADTSNSNKIDNDSIYQYTNQTYSFGVQVRASNWDIANALNGCTVDLYCVIHELDDLGLQDLTLDQIKAQRPDLFVPQPYHTTEKRIGIIFNDGSVDRLDSPLYAVNDIKDEYKTNGVVNRKLGVVDLGTLNWANVTGGFQAQIQNAVEGKGTTIDNILCSKYQAISGIDQYTASKTGICLGGSGVGSKSNVRVSDNNYTDATAFKTAMSGVMLVYELATPTTELREPIAEGKVLPIVNEPYTQSAEQTPSPSYPREIEHTSKFKWNDLELPLDLYNGDKIIASRKVGKNIWDEETQLGYYASNGSWITSTEILSSKNFIKVKPSSDIYVRISNNHAVAITFWDINKNFISRVSSRQNRTTTIPENCHYILFNTANTYGTTYNHDIMICLASEVDKTYEPYLKDKVWKYQANATYVFTGQESWTGLGSEHNNNFYNATILTNAKFEHDIYVFCDILKGQVSGGADGNYKNSIWLQSNSQYTRLYINIGDITQSEIGSVLANHKLVYPLAQPQWIDLTNTLGSMLNDLTPNATQEFSVDNGTLSVSYFKATTN